MAVIISMAIIAPLKISIPSIEIIATMGKFALLPIKISDIGKINKTWFVNAVVRTSKNAYLTLTENTFLATRKVIK